MHTREIIDEREASIVKPHASALSPAEAREPESLACDSDLTVGPHLEEPVFYACLLEMALEGADAAGSIVIEDLLPGAAGPAVRALRGTDAVKQQVAYLRQQRKLAMQTALPQGPTAATPTAAAAPPQTNSSKTRAAAPQAATSQAVPNNDSAEMSSSAKPVEPSLDLGIESLEGAFAPLKDDFPDLSITVHLASTFSAVWLQWNDNLVDVKLFRDKSSYVTETTNTIVDGWPTKTAVLSKCRQLLSPQVSVPIPRFERPDPTGVMSVGGYMAAAHTIYGRPADRSVVQPDKRTITAVYGETGSGKTTYAARELCGTGSDDVTVYHCLNHERVPAGIIQAEKEEVTTNAAKLSVLGRLFLELSTLLPCNQVVGEAIRWQLRSVSRQLHTERDAAAREFIEDTFRQAACKAIGGEVWYKSENRTKIQQLTIIIDEIGQCLELARGIASAQVAIYAALEPYADRVELVVVGTGADAMQPSGESRPSTDPGQVSRVRIDPPQGDGGLALLRQVADGGVKGSGSRVDAIKNPDDKVLKALLTNARLTVLLGQSLKTQPTDVVNLVLPFYMEAALRTFRSMSGFGSLGREGGKHHLTDTAYMALMGVTAPPTPRYFDLDPPANFGQQCEECLLFGLLLRKEGGGYFASNAMRLIAATNCGRLVNVRDGTGFDPVAGLLLRRHFDVLGYRSGYVRLVQPFPSASGIVQSDFRAIVEAFANSHTITTAVIIENGVNAPGADFIVLRRCPSRSGRATLLHCDLIGCRNVRRHGPTIASQLRMMGIQSTKGDTHAVNAHTGVTMQMMTDASIVNVQQRAVFTMQALLEKIDAVLMRSTSLDKEAFTKLVLAGNSFDVMPFAPPGSRRVTTSFVLLLGTASNDGITDGITPYGEVLCMCGRRQLGLWSEFIEEASQKSYAIAE